MDQIHTQRWGDTIPADRKYELGSFGEGDEDER